MARLLQSVTTVDVGTVNRYWRAYLKGTGQAYWQRLVVCAQTMRLTWEANDAWIANTQSKLAHEAQATLRAVNRQHQAIGVRLAEVESSLDLIASKGDVSEGDQSALWMAAAVPLAFLPDSIAAGVTTVGNQLRVLTSAPDIVIEVGATTITLMTLATAPGQIAWMDETALRLTKAAAPAGSVIANVMDGAYDTASAILSAAAAAAKGAAGLIASAPGWVPVAAIGALVYMVKK